MNPTIQELMIKVGVHRYVTADCQRRMELLAQAVAEHCAAICEQGSGTQTTSAGAALLIRQYFDLTTKEQQ